MNIIRFMYLLYIIQRNYKVFPTYSFIGIITLLFSILPNETLTQYITKLGPLYIKIGQLLSTRSGLIKKDIVRDLEKLKDKAPPSISQESIEKYITDYMKKNDFPCKFSLKKLIGSASISQVYTCYIDSKECVVKVVRPNTIKRIHRDFKSINTTINIITFFIPFDNKRKGFISKLQQICTNAYSHIMSETDLYRECASIEKFSKIDAIREICHIPGVYKTLSSKNILFMEKKEGYSIHDIIAWPREMKTRVIQNIVNISLIPTLLVGFSHGDIHSGNIMINSDGSINLIDFGNTVILSEEEKEFILLMIEYIGNKDYSSMSSLLLEKKYIIPRNKYVSKNLELPLISLMENIYISDKEGKYFNRFIANFFQSFTDNYSISLPINIVTIEKNFLLIESMKKTLSVEESISSIIYESYKKYRYYRAKNKMYSFFREKSAQSIQKVLKIL